MLIYLIYYNINFKIFNIPFIYYIYNLFLIDFNFIKLKISKIIIVVIYKCTFTMNIISHITKYTYF